MREIIKKHFGLFSVLIVVLIVFSNVTPANVTAQPDGPETKVTVEQAILDKMETQGTASYWIQFENEVTLSPAYDMDWSERGWFVYETLLAQAEKSQSQVRAYLQKNNIEYQSYWINNSILVTSSTNSILSNLTQFANVKRMEARKTFFLHEPDRNNAITDNGVNSIEPNITHVNANDVWSKGIDGTGLVVANIDTGVRYSHQALVNQYRGNNGDGTFDHNYNWYDPYGDYVLPTDYHGHGTHTMGTIVGDDGGSNQIGMAPGAEWIACRGCNTSDCGDLQLLACGQFIAAPTNTFGDNPNPDMRPHVVNNSWGDCATTYDSWYEGPINAWHAAGIYPIFSNGNAGNSGYSSPPGLNTVGNPARSGNVTGVGSSGEQNGLYASHSNWGPTDNLDIINPKDGLFPEMKPQVLAPGVSIRSSTPGSDREYQDGWSGTSMSAPHVAGLVALIWQAAPCLVGDYGTTERIIEETAVYMVYDDGSGLTPSNFPNFATGWGEIDALAAVKYAPVFCSTGSLGGKVTTDGITPVEAATVTAENGTGLSLDTLTLSDGTYSMNLPGGTYNVSATKYGYSEAIETEIEVHVDGSTKLDFNIYPLLSVIPTELEQAQLTNNITNQSFTIVNPSASEIDFELLELPEDSLLLENVELFLETGDDIPWLSLYPMTGMVPAGETVVITVTYDSSDLGVADYLGSIQINQAPAPPINLPVTLHVIDIPKLYLPWITK